MTEKKIWVRVGSCPHCHATIWVWMGGRGTGPHMRVDACEHLINALMNAREHGPLSEVITTSNDTLTSHFSRALVNAIRISNSDAREHIPSRIRHMAISLETALAAQLGEDDE